MRSQFISSIRGYVKIQVRGNHIESFINEALYKNYSLWDIRRTSIDQVQMSLLVRDFFRLRPLLKKTSCRVHVKERIGFPFILDKLERRKFFAVGIIVFILGLYALSSVVWHVQVDGNDKIPTEQILQAAKQQGIYPMQWKFRLKDQDRLSKQLMDSIPGTAWVGVSIEGTQIHIKVVEYVVPEERPLMNPRHLVADTDAVVTDIFTEKGRPMVKPNTKVKKGDLLISGILGDEEHQQIVVAKGVVKGLVWHEYSIEVPLIQKHKVYTGRSKEQLHFVLGNRALQITGYGKPKFPKQEIYASRKTLQWRNVSIPLGWIREKVLEISYRERKIDLNEAKSAGLQQARADLLQKSGKDANIKAENILHEQVENGKVYMKVLFEAEEEIMQEQPIVRGD